MKATTYLAAAAVGALGFVVYEVSGEASAFTYALVVLLVAIESEGGE